MSEPACLCAPIRLAPYYAEALWGGTAIADRFRRTGLPPVCSESWEISGHPSHPGVVADGPLAGRALPELVREFGRGLLGTRAPDPATFPLLVKLIDARKRLSLQVHPSEATAKIAGGEPKTEMWYVVAAEPGAFLYAGVRWSWPPMPVETLRAAIESDTVEPLLNRLDVRAGDAVFIPGGLAHAICEGCLIFEIQQSSDTTFRLSDWGRVDAHGERRQLHLDQGLRAIETGLPNPAIRRDLPAANAGANAWTDILSCPFFRLRRIDLREAATLRSDGSTFAGLFALQGAFDVVVDGQRTACPAGTSLLLPAALPEWTAEPAGGKAAVLVVTLGE
ncbi:MAG: type I phosphomannose isomerase catalytic subunit [Kiritimatiellia bacterium]|jgi:mannose-6-phosphate isomerase